MSVYETLDAATRDRDAEKFIELLHEDFVFVRHHTGTSMNRSEMAELIRRLMSSDATAVHDQRCLYENDEVLVEHSVMDFPDGTREAVMGVHKLKDGKIIRTETGATPLGR